MHENRFYVQKSVRGMQWQTFKLLYYVYVSIPFLCEVFGQGPLPSPQHTRILTYKDALSTGMHLDVVQRTLNNFPPGPYRTFIENSNFPAINDYLALRNTGELTVVKLLDRDDRDSVCGPLKCCTKPQCEINFHCVFMPTQSGAGPIDKTQKTRVRVILYLIDTNDNAPYFSMKHYNISIDEGDSFTQPLELPVGKDLDSKENGITQYSLIPISPPLSSIFSLTYQPDSIPRMYIRRKLDYENSSQRWFVFHLLAIDGGMPALTGTMTINVRVNDLNDSPPECSPGSTEIAVPENTTMTQPIYKLNCTDRDSGLNGEITYAFGGFLQPSSSSEKFQIDAQTGDVHLRDSLDYEKFSERNFVLPIQVSDKGAPVKTFTFTLTVRTKDVNDNPPELRVKQNISIPENSSPGMEALELYVSDADELSTGKVQCFQDSSLSSTAELRLEKLSETVFLVYTNVAFDYEKQKIAQLSVKCTDGELTMREELSVAIVDVNDNSPSFLDTCPIRRSVSEDFELNAPILTPTARDPDSGTFGEVTYQLVQDTADSLMFHMSSSNGHLSLMKSLDRELRSQYHISVIARDGGGKEAICEIEVVVTDVNDNAPYLVGDVFFDVVEHSVPGTRIAHLQFQDKDEGNNALVDIMLVAGHIKGGTGNASLNLSNFEMRTNGELLIRGDIDREIHDRLILTVIGVDRGEPSLTTTVSVYITVEDINDNSPMFEYPLLGVILGYEPTIYRNSPRATRVVQIQGSDKDVGNNGSILYYLLPSNGTDLFQINETSGIVTTSWGLLVYPEEGIYEIIVQLRDQGIPERQSSQGSFYINVGPLMDDPNEIRFGSIARISNIVILVLIVLLSVALGAALIAAIIWAKARTSVPASRWSTDQRNYHNDYASHLKMLMTTNADSRGPNNGNGSDYGNGNLNGYKDFNIPPAASQLLLDEGFVGFDSGFCSIPPGTLFPSSMTLKSVATPPNYLEHIYPSPPNSDGEQGISIAHTPSETRPPMANMESRYMDISGLQTLGPQHHYSLGTLSHQMSPFTATSSSSHVIPQPPSPSNGLYADQKLDRPPPSTTAFIRRIPFQPQASIEELSTSQIISAAFQPPNAGPPSFQTPNLTHVSHSNLSNRASTQSPDVNGHFQHKNAVLQLRQSQVSCADSGTRSGSEDDFPKQVSQPTQFMGQPVHVSVGNSSVTPRSRANVVSSASNRNVLSTNVSGSFL